MSADAAEADDTEGLALKLDALGVGLLVPDVVAHGSAGDGDEAGAGEHVSERALSNGLAGSVGGVAHHDAVLLGILDVDVVNADAAADDELEVAALGLVDVGSANLGLGADDDHVEAAQCLAELFALVELLNDLVTLSLQLGHRGLIHTVGNKNTHSNFLLVK